MKILAIALVAMGISATAYADSKGGQEWYARIVGGAGSIIYQGKEVTMGQMIDHDGILETAAESSAVLHFKGKATDLTLGPKTKVQLSRPDPNSPKSYEVLQGICRWSVSKSSQPTKWLKIRTHSAIMAVRGTDFYVTYFPTLNESEIVVFEGLVDFTNGNDVRDSKQIPAGHWGGVGGRFGKRIGDLMQLSPQMLADLKKQVDVKPSITDPENLKTAGDAH